MAGGSNQKLRLIYLAKIFMEKTDEEHYLTTTQLIDALSAYGISVERKTIYTDMESLRTVGLDIIGQQVGKVYYYHLGGRQFELAELKLLVDSVQSAKFITEKKSNQLIKKLEGLTSKYEAKQLQRQVYVAGRIKAHNESIYYNVDQIHTAIGNNVKIQFQYFQWNVNKEQVLRHHGKTYCISPWALSWDDENYYLVGFDNEADQIKHYRVDKMLKLKLTSEKREGEEYFKQFNMAAYAKKMFGMFGGEEEIVKLRCKNEFAGVIIDRFGKDVMMIKL